MRIFHIALAFSLLLAVNAIAQEQSVDQQIDDSLGDHTKFRPVIEGLQKAVASHDAEALSKLISYPLAVKTHGKAQSIKSAKSLSRITTPSLRRTSPRLRRTRNMKNSSSAIEA